MQPIFQYKSFPDNEDFVAWQKEQIEDFKITQIIPCLFSSVELHTGSTQHNMGILITYYYN